MLFFVSKGGTKDCDHWHQGAGFVTSHMALTLMYEQSLQTVNPAVTVPYWDFTLESTFFGSTDFRTSGVFADDWFGEASPSNVRISTSMGECNTTRYGTVVTQTTY